MVPISETKSFLYWKVERFNFEYGTLMEEGRWKDDEWLNDIDDLQILKKSLFFKTSYRHVF